jgi:TonB-dependent receptor
MMSFGINIRAVMLSCVAPAALLMPASVYAQTSPRDAPAPADTATTSASDSQGADITVTGIRRSLADARAIKESSSAIVDAISAEDIGKFPDQNLAESLQRVTGVQIQRSNGEGTRISVRGLSPDFTRTQYNGRTITSNGQRSFDFSSLSSDFVSAVEVYKTPTADMIDGGLSATVNVRIARPLDLGKNRVMLAAEGIYEGNSKKIAPHLTGFVNRLFGDGKVGVYFGVDYRQRKYQTATEYGFGMQPFAENASLPRPLDYNLDGDFNDTVRIENALGTGVAVGDSKRLTLVGGFQAKPTDELELWTDVLYSNLKDRSTNSFIAPRFVSIEGPNAAIRGSVVQNGVATYLDADGVWIQSTGGDTESYVATISPAAGATWRRDRLTISAEANYSHTLTETSSLAVEGIGRGSVSYDLRPDGDTFPQITFNRGWDPLNPHNYRAVGFRGAYKSPTNDSNWTLRGDVAYKFDDSFIKKISAGINLSERKLSFQSANVIMNAQQLAGLLGVPYDPNIEGGSFDSSVISTNFSFPNIFQSYSGPAKPLTAGVATSNAILFSKVPLSKILAISPPTGVPASDFSVDEKSLAAYAKIDFGTSDNKLSGNLGVRYVRTRQTSIGSVPDFNNITLLQLAAQTVVGTKPAGSVKNNYGNWLPSFNLRYAITDNLVARIGAARVMTRPTLGLLTTSTNINAQVQSISSGNPRLNPFLANQGDLSLEYYFANTGLLSVAVFYKDIKNFVVNATASETYAVHIGTNGPLQNVTFAHSFPDNGAGAKLKGIELGVQVPFTFLPSPLDGFGVLANATFLDVGKVTPSSGAAPTPLPGVSNRAYNAALYYEKYGFGARVSYTYRSKFTNDLSSYFGDGDFARSYGQLDASMSYDVNKNISLNIDGANLMNSPSITYNNINIVRYYEDSGRRFTAGVRVRF